ncbi:hypothetical protein B0H10DRAFT_2237504 [Mycena sp. CBHHK59/15]|nr:hypothetical protein B0H10DRAFT_2237504 [Mycena sp. CBHHK59/15]
MPVCGGIVGNDGDDEQVADTETAGEKQTRAIRAVAPDLHHISGPKHHDAAALAPLPAATRATLRSTQILTSLAQIVSELLQNALDAGARQIDIGVDCETWSCWVRDDGAGMSRDGMDILARGLEDGRYGTSKAYAPDSLHDLSTFGFRGEALASCADICCLEIASRATRSRETWSVIIKGSKTLYTGPAVRWRRESPGTTICIRDAFYNRQRARSTPSGTRSRRSPSSSHVAFTLENTHSTRDDKDMLLRIPKHVDEINLTSGELQLDGFISLDGAHSKVRHTNSCVRHPLCTTRYMLGLTLRAKISTATSPCALHHAVDARFAASSFAKHAFDEAGETHGPRSTARRSPRKAEQRAAYVLNLTVPPRLVDNCLEPAKGADTGGAVAFVAGAVQAFLVRHGFAPAEPQMPLRGSPEKRQRGSPSSRKRRRLDDDEDDAEAGDDRVPASRAPSPVPLYTRDTGYEELLWTDPHTRQLFVVDARTGNSHRPSEPPDGAAPHEHEGRTLARQMARGANDIYATTEAEIPAVAPQPAAPPHACHLAECLRTGQPQAGPATAVAQRFTKADLESARVLSQVDRKFVACGVGRALVLIDQHAADERVRVERFLRELCLGYLAIASSSGASGLRLRVLSPAVPVLLSRREERQLRDPGVRCAFTNWGFRFGEDEAQAQGAVEGGVDAGSASGYGQVFVESVPEVVGDKLLLDDELRNFVKAFLARLEDDRLAPHPEATSSEEDDEFHWLRALRWCPQQLLDLVNSKACRGAIMFNDSLTHAQCEKLVENLCKTAFPFQCAHGRPSLVPLIDLGDDQGRQRTRSCQWSTFGVGSQ